MVTKTDVWQGLMDRAYDKWQGTGWSYERFLLNLDSVERKAVLLGNFNHQTCNGGLQQWVDNGYASGGGAELLLVLAEIGTESAKKALKIAEGVLEHVDLSAKKGGFGEDYWLESWVDEEPPACYDEVERLTGEYYSLESFEADVEGYLNAQVVN
ncbi:MAG: hypothetical protein DRQ40_04035 [Gammaproteobacteria bacterium]|nr:MAG: hypothetical protein DRQ40_04035 [Gammaproteobacteria bacterium]